MKLNLFVSLFLITFVFSCASKKADKEQEPTELADVPVALDWNYSAKGPGLWSGLNPKYELCAKGQKQSPINLKWSKPSRNRDLSFFYIPGVFQLERNNGMLQVIFSKGNYTVIDGKKWNLVAMQVHTPAEHQFSGKTHPAELQFVHVDEENSKIAMIAMFLKAGRPNLGIETLLNSAPKKALERVFVEAISLNPSVFLPLASTHYYYEGSLTQPPCSEGVEWTVLNTPVEASADQIAKLQALSGNNARPIQKLNNRKVTNFNRY